MKQYIPLCYLPESKYDSILTYLVNYSWKLQGLLSDLEASKFLYHFTNFALDSESQTWWWDKHRDSFNFLSAIGEQTG